MQAFLGTPLTTTAAIARPMLAGAVGLAAIALSAMPAQATTFDISTLDEYQTGTGNRVTYYGLYTGPNQTGTHVFSGTGAQLTPWTQGTGAGTATLDWLGFGGQGNNSGKIYYTSGGLFPIPTGQTLGQNMSGYSGDYAQSNGMPLYFDFSNPTGTTAAQVTLNSLYISAGPSTGLTILGYSDLGTTLVDTYTTTAALGDYPNPPAQVPLNWTGIAFVEIVGSGPGSCGGTSHACASGFYVNDIEVNDPLPAVPEPMSISLLATGLIGLGSVVRRRRA